MKKVATILLVCFIMMTFAVNTFAATPKVSPDMQKLIGDYNLKVVDKLPNGITPIEYKTVTEARVALEKIKKASELNKARVEKNLEMVKAVETQNGLSPITIQSTGYKVYQVFTGPYYRNLRVDYQYIWNGTRNVFTQCTNINSWISGITMGFTWTQTGSYSAILDGGRTLYAKADAKLDHYLIIEGVGVIYTTNETIDNYFS